MLWLMSLGSRQSRIDPSCLETRTTLLIQSTVCPWTGSTIPELHNLSSSSLYADFFFAGTARGGWCTVFASSLSWMWYLPQPPPPPPPPPYISLIWDNTYSFAMSKQCLFSFRKIASSNNSDVGLVTFLESGCRALTLVWICGVLLKEGGVTSRKAM